LEIWQTVRKADPTNAIAKKKLGWVYDEMGDREAEFRRGKEALEFHSMANEIFQAMIKKEPENAELQWYLAHSHYRLATARRLLGDRLAAERDDREALRLREHLAKADPNNLQRIEELMISRARRGDHQAAAKAADDLRKRVPKDASVLVSAACCYGACIQAAQAYASDPGVRRSEVAEVSEKYAAAARESVKEAISLGFRDAFALQHNPNLEPLQTDERYKTLLAQAKQP
jgi:tetratricopeptide (TPR) repeat protein